MVEEVFFHTDSIRKMKTEKEIVSCIGDPGELLSGEVITVGQ